jgi:putative heme iron utilization protein
MSDEGLKPHIDPIRPTDDAALALAERLIRTSRFGALGTVDADGHPFVSLVSVATDIDATPLILVSRLSAHTTHLLEDPRCSLLLGEPGRGDPLAHPRLTLICAARPVVRESDEGTRIRRRFLARHPKAALYADFGDFLFMALEPQRASLNGGFGKAYLLSRNDLRPDPTAAARLGASEETIIASLNAEMADALALLAGERPTGRHGTWRITGLDPKGCDLAAGDQVARLAFGETVSSETELRAIFMRMISQMREENRPN